MNFKLELPSGTILVDKKELREVLHEVLTEVNEGDVYEEVMTIREAAEYLKVSVPTVRKMIVEKEIPYFQRGQVIRLNRKELQNWMKQSSS
ncbi:helix-turn-helix domain-containing protein [Oceanobacillus halophilus]|uniref:DNA-binding protein n=1 Tax=Oceanobacillus halophilus TaxID=930130 RepID=A0A494ZZD0_9BACI|nr:helix-turn-helix domain-containing protein [Oceanobacillus halophilus]RKQ32309.1 DNA-binding protein [Oceanobacillus halophilus]